MPLWCAEHLRKQPQQWIKATLFRDGKNLCKECFEHFWPELSSKPAPIVPTSTPQPPDFAAEAQRQLASVPDSGPAVVPAEEVVPEDKPHEENNEMAKKLCKGGCGTEVNSRFDFAYGHKGGCPGKAAASVSTPAKAALAVKGKYAVTNPLEATIADLKTKRDKLNQAIEALENLNQ